MKLITALLLLFLPQCSLTDSDIHLKPNQKFIDGEVKHNRLIIQSRESNNEPPEIILFQDGQGNDFTIYER